MAGIAELDERRGDAKSAEKGYRQAIELLEKGFGADHPAVRDVRRSYAHLLRSLGREVEAQEIEHHASARPGADGRS